MFITDLWDGNIFVGGNTGPSFFSSEFEELQLTGVQSPVSLDFDHRNDMIYWTDEETKTVNRATLDGSFQEAILQTSQGIGSKKPILDFAFKKKI